MFRLALSLLLLSTLRPDAANAAENPRELLSMIAGDWTVEGREDSFRETCEWFHNRSHLVCTSESRRPAGTSRGVSVFSYSEAKGRFLYYHYGSSGVAVAMDAFLRDGSLFATAERQAGTDLLREQVRMTPRADGTFDFVEEVSTNGGPWKTTTQVHYIRRAPAQ
jgi:hypothetical protein